MRLLESKYSFLAFFFVLIISCNNHRDKGNISETSYSLRDFAECDLEVFTPNENITVILDSVIEKTIQCERYTNLPLGFLFESYIDNQENHIITISNIVDIHEFYYAQCSGLFYRSALHSRWSF